MEGAHDDFFPVSGGEFGLIQHDDFDLDTGDNQQHHQQPLQEEHHVFQAFHEDHPLNNGLDSSPLENPKAEFKRENMLAGASVADASPTSLGAPMESPRPGPAIEGGPFSGAPAAAQEDEQQQTEQQQQQQRQLKQEIEAREKEEETLRREQRQIAEEEIKTFYEQRMKHLERRRAQIKEQAAAAAAKERNSCGSGWARVLSLVEKSSSSSSSSSSSGAPAAAAAAASKDKDRAEMSKLRKMLAELAAETAKA